MLDELVQADTESVLRDRAVKQLKKKRDFHAHLLVYALVNTCLIAVWFVTGQHGFFWPIFPIAFWGIGVVMNGWDVYHPDQFAEDDIQREMQRMRG